MIYTSHRHVYLFWVGRCKEAAPRSLLRMRRVTRGVRCSQHPMYAVGDPERAAGSPAWSLSGLASLRVELRWAELLLPSIQRGGVSGVVLREGGVLAGDLRRHCFPAHPCVNGHDRVADSPLVYGHIRDVRAGR